MRGEDARVLSYVEGVKVDVGGVANAEVTDLGICQSAGIVETIGDGPVIVIMPQYADYGEGETIHSTAQMRKFGTIVDESCLKPLHDESVGGVLCL